MAKLGRVDSPKTRGYVLTTVKRVSFTHYDKRKRESHISLDTFQNEYPDKAHLENDILSTIHYEELLKTISTLPTKCKEVLMMKFVDGLAGNEMASMLAISESAVSQRLAKGLKMLNAIVVREGEDHG